MVSGNPPVLKRMNLFQGDPEHHRSPTASQGQRQVHQTPPDLRSEHAGSPATR